VVACASALAWFSPLRGQFAGFSSANGATLLQGGDIFPPPRGQPGVEHRGNAGPLSALVSLRAWPGRCARFVPPAISLSWPIPFVAAGDSPHDGTWPKAEKFRPASCVAALVSAGFSQRLVLPANDAHQAFVIGHPGGPG
jgi:hypothetical protein